jgi:hypothetical protein
MLLTLFDSERSVLWRVIRDERERIEDYEDTGERSSLFYLFCIAGFGTGKNSPGHEKSS